MIKQSVSEYQQKEIKTSSGPVIGVIDDGILYYLGIPYAAAPIGELRWKPPVPSEPWKQARLMNKFSPACAQFEVGIAPGNNEVNERCLTLNIWTPAPDESVLLPVMMFIHGGGFARGTSAEPMYNGKYLAKNGVVLITINYRLNAFGFLAHPALTARSTTGSSGNYGIMDQIFALKWIRENIRMFGGNPDNITVFGNSAGAASVAALMASSQAKGLFHRAIIQSGGYPPSMLRHLNKTQRNLESMESLGTKFSEVLGIDNNVDTVKELSSRSWQDIASAWERAVQPKITGIGISGAWMLNHLIEDGYILEKSPREIFRQGKQNNVPLMIGTVADEGTIIPLLMTVSNEEKYHRYLNKCFGKLYQKVENRYPVDKDSSVKKTLGNLIRDGFFAGARAMAYHMSDIQPDTYLYQFTMQPKIFTWTLPGVAGRENEFGCYHAAELPCIFQSVNSSKFQEKDLRFHEQVMNYWIRFARSGNPNGDDATFWPAFDRSEEKHIILDLEIKTGHHLHKETCDFIDELDSNRESE